MSLGQMLVKLITLLEYLDGIQRNPQDTMYKQQVKSAAYGWIRKQL